MSQFPMKPCVLRAARGAGHRVHSSGVKPSEQQASGAGGRHFCCGGVLVSLYVRHTSGQGKKRLIHV